MGTHITTVVGLPLSVAEFCLSRYARAWEQPKYDTYTVLCGLPMSSAVSTNSEAVTWRMRLVVHPAQHNKSAGTISDPILLRFQPSTVLAPPYCLGTWQGDGKQ